MSALDPAISILAAAFFCVEMKSSGKRAVEAGAGLPFNETPAPLVRNMALPVSCADIDTGRMEISEMQPTCRHVNRRYPDPHSSACSKDTEPFRPKLLSGVVTGLRGHPGDRMLLAGEDSTKSRPHQCRLCSKATKGPPKLIAEVIDYTQMDKRTFLKFCSAMVTSPILSSLLPAEQTGKLTNWAGNLEYGTERLTAANSLESVQDFVRKHNRFKVLGSRHCFNDIANSKDEFLSLKAMDKIVSLDAKNRTVTVEAGMTYGQLCPHLDREGWALHNLASLPHISIAGACSTATHGSGEKNGNLATAVSALEMVDAAGNVVKFSRQSDPDVFHSAVVGLGALGVVTKVTLDVQPRFTMQQNVYQDLPLRELKNHFDEIESAAYSVSLFTDWKRESINEVWLKTRMESDQTWVAPKEFFGAKLATKNLHPIVELSAENCTEQMGVPGPWYERLPHFRMGFTPSAGKELQSEFFVPRKHAVEAILAIQRLHAQISPHLLISEIRTIAADELWLSPCYQQPSVTLHFTWQQDWPAVSKLLPVIEKVLAPFDPAPHWGKLFAMHSDKLRARYKRLPEFVQLIRKYDPKGKFQNDFLRENVLTTSS